MVVIYLGGNKDGGLEWNSLLTSGEKGENPKIRKSAWSFGGRGWLGVVGNGSRG